MDGYDILVGGLPPGTNNRKFQLYVEKQIEGRKIAKVGKLEDGRVGIMFSDIEGLQKFLEAEIKTYTFGGKTYELNYAELEPAVSKEEEKQESRMPDQATRRDQRDNDMWRRKLHVSNIPRHLHAYSAFRFHFERFGPLEKCFMESRKSYALITFMNHDAALQAKMYGVEAAPNIFMKIQWCRKEERQGQQQYQEPRRPPTSFHQSRSFHEQRHYPPGAQQYQGNPPYYRGPMPQDRRSSAENDPRSPERLGQYGQYSQGRLSRSVSSSALNFNLRYQNIAEDEGAYGGRRYEMDDLHHPQDADPRVENPPPLMSLPTQNPDANSQTESANSKPKPATRRKARNKQKNKNPDGKNNQAENTLYQNIHYWTDLEELPAAGGTACVLAQNIDPSTDFQTVRMHFESKKRSGGGPVKSIIRMNDGFLITFQNQDDSDTCAQKTDQTFEEKELKIFSKIIPSYHERKFVVKGAGQKVTKGTLKMFLEACTKDEVEPSFCELQEIPGVYRVEYHEDEFDVAETEEFLSKIAAKELVGSKLTASRLLRSDCLKVTGVPPGASDDEIKLMFESKKRTDGGPVTSIERLKNNVVLVYFAQYTVAERIYNRFKKPCIEVIVIADKVVEVELFYHSLSKEYAGASKKKKSSAKTNGGDKEGDIQTLSTGPTGTVKTIQLKPSCDERVFFFIRRSKKHYNVLKDDFKDIARIELCDLAKAGRVVKFFPTKKEGDQEEYNEKCAKYFKEFVSQFSTKSKSFDKEKLQKARDLKINPLLDQMADKREQDDFAIKWQQASGTVDVTGLKEVVDSTIADIESSVDSNTANITTNEEGYSVMVHCGIIKELAEKFRKVKIHCDDEKKTISLTGSTTDTQQMQIEILTYRSMVKSKKVPDLHECARRYLVDNAAAVKKIQDRISTGDIKAEFGIDGEDVRLQFRDIGDFQRAFDVVKRMVVVESITTDGATTNVVQSPEWKTFQQSIQSQGNCGIYLKAENSIVLVGLQSEVRKLRTKIDNFLDENAIRRDYITMAYGHAKFILERKHSFSPDNPKRKAISCGLTPQYGGGLFIEGIQANINAARLEINKILKFMIQSNHALREPGIKNYYLGSEGNEFLDTTSRVNNCIILINSPDCEEWVKFNSESRSRPARALQAKSSPVDAMERNMASVKLGKVTLTVWKANIIQHRCDVIVNASNKELALLPGGVSGVIKKYDMQNANQIQEEMKEIVRKNYGSLTPGEAVITGAGNLPNCKKIVHAVGPKWNDPSEGKSNPAGVLQACILRSLEETNKAKLRSISIPAISCGVFGGIPSTCIPLILKTVTDYFKDTPTSFITQVDFVELNNQNVLNEFTRAVSKLGGSSKKSTAPKTSSSAPTAVPRSSIFANFSPFSSSSSSSSQSVANLVQGDISTQNVDVIVNIMAPNHIQNMLGGSVIAKVLGNAAGQAVVNECSQSHGKYNVGDVFSTSAGFLSCNNLYHGLIGSFSQNHSEAAVKKIVRDCIRLAQRSGYQSIAFPAIGTGGFKHPPQLVAKWMREAVTKYSSLTNVSIVLHPSNPTALAAFQAEFSGNPPQSQSTGQSSGFSSSVTFGPLTVSVMQDDITTQQVDAIVNSTNSRFDLTQGMISRQILQQGGNAILNALQNASGDLAITHGGNLPCKHVIHLVTPTDSNDLGKKIVKVMQLADSQGISSVAIPALGTGNISMDSATVGAAMRAGIETFIKLYPRPSSLNAVDIVIFDQSMVQDFKDAILGDGTPKTGKLRKFIEGVRDLFSPPSKEDKSKEILNLYLFANNKQNIDQAVRHIESENKKVIDKQLIDDEILAHLTAREMFEIEEIEKKYDVRIENRRDRYLNRLTVVGLTKNVMKAYDAIKSVLRELSEAETRVEYIAWETLASNSKWVELPSRAAHCLEKAYKATSSKKLKQVDTTQFQYNKIVTVTYDLSTMGNDPQGNNPPKIRRRPKEKGESDALPSSWDDMQGNHLMKVPLAQGSLEYSRVLRQFTSTGVNPNNPKILRIQSVSLYKQYAAKKAEVTKKLQGTNHRIERQLFHGTTNADKIVSNGFDRSFAGTHAAAYGNGVYFATTASYSNSYAQPGANGIRTMFLADVITGAFAQGSSGMRTPPARTHLDLYDSVVNQVQSPTMYIIFKDASAYPTYLLEYT